jgi:hypothetical protein
MGSNPTPRAYLGSLYKHNKNEEKEYSSEKNRFDIEATTNLKSKSSREERN